MAQRYRFDGFELDTSERLLYRDGQPVGLGARAIALLTALLGRPGRLVTKAELLDRVWPGLVVEENNLQVQVSAVRKVLGAHMIVTVPGGLPLRAGGAVRWASARCDPRRRRAPAGQPVPGTPTPLPRPCPCCPRRPPACWAANAIWPPSMSGCPLP